MSDPSGRPRPHPDDRFRGPQHRFDLGEVTANLLNEPAASQRDHRQETLYRHGPMTIALFLFQRGANLPQHRAEGTVSVHVLEGRLKMSVEGQNHVLSSGQILTMAPGVPHDVFAEEPTRMLLTVCLESPAQ